MSKHNDQIAMTWANGFLSKLKQSPADLEGQSDSYDGRQILLEEYYRVTPKGAGFDVFGLPSISIEKRARECPDHEKLLRRILSANYKAGINSPALWNDIASEILLGTFVCPPKIRRPPNTLLRNIIFKLMAIKLTEEMGLALNQNDERISTKPHSACKVIQDAYRKFGGSAPSTKNIYRIVTEDGEDWI